MVGSYAVVDTGVERARPHCKSKPYRSKPPAGRLSSRPPRSSDLHPRAMKSRDRRKCIRSRNHLVPLLTRFDW